MAGRIVGIDLGTTNSEVAAVTARGVEIIEENGESLTPSCVGLAPDGRVLVGRTALNQEALYPDRTARSVKRLMGTEEEIRLGTEVFRPQEVSALILADLKDKAERVLGEPVEAAVITVPAYFSDAQRQATREAGEIAGLRVPRILNEPTAAALAFPTAEEAAGGSGTPGKGRTVLVYDLGGGTFDVSIVRIEGDVTEVLASHGDVRLGGDDFDRLVLDHVLTQAEASTIREAILRDRGVRARLLRATETARCKLSHEPHVRLRMDSVIVEHGVSRHLDEEIRREDLESWLASLLERTMKSVHAALEEAGLGHGDLDEILLAGGATRTPIVGRLLEEATGCEVNSVLHPDLCVALGAGLAAGRLEGRTEAGVLVDVTPYTFGARHLGEVHGLPSIHVFKPLIRRNTPLPVSCTEPFFTTLDAQERADISIFQGEDPDTRQNIAVGQFVLDDLQDTPAGNEILIRLDLDLDGILSVTATESATNRAHSIRIEGAVGLLGARDLSHARGRVRRLRGGAESEPPEAEEATPDETLPPGARDLVSRCERRLPEMPPADRKEAEGLLEAIRSGDEEAIAPLEDLLFYVGEGGA